MALSSSAQHATPLEFGEKWEVLTLVSFSLPCNIRDTAWCWKKILLFFFYVQVRVTCNIERHIEGSYKKNILVLPRNIWNYLNLLSNNFKYFLPEILKVYGERLSEWERTEVRKYPEVWFLGLEANKVQARSNLPNNCGFDDENGSYNKVRNFIHYNLKE